MQLYWLLWLLMLKLWISLSDSQMVWTPIYVDGSSQVDLWTKEGKGCQCPFDSERHDCACCVLDGGCPCGEASPNRCAQCGLEDYCGNMCNITINSKQLVERSGKTFGQIKSPSLEGPGLCWYVLQPENGQRVEIQVYRLVSAGRFNGTSCVGGYLQLVDGVNIIPRPGESQVCGDNERFSPPVVLFADKGDSMLIFNIIEATYRSQFLAYFSFTSPSSTVGVQEARGGQRINNTDCDWQYSDVSCQEMDSCVLSSPGYPGLYPPYRKCKYYISSASEDTQIIISFSAILLPHNHCTTDYVALYRGSTRSGPLLTSLCASKKTRLQFTGPELLLEFSSGAPMPPYNYNGFQATLSFVDKISTTETSQNQIPTDSGVMMDGTASPNSLNFNQTCELVFYSNSSKSGQFDTRDLPWSRHCALKFFGGPTDVVHISLFNYRLRSHSCKSSLDIYYGRASSKSVRKICSPITKHARDSRGRFLELQTFLSPQPIMTLMFHRHMPPTLPTDAEFVDGAFHFHDQLESGILKPTSLCDVEFKGSSSPCDGRITTPGMHHTFWNVEGFLKCTHRFIPADNQSLTLKIMSLSRITPDPNCHTQCGDGGCECVSEMLPLKHIDHLLLVDHSGRSLACLCGEFQEDWLPVSVQTWSPLNVVYSVAQYNWNSKKFTFTADYSFLQDSICSQTRTKEPSGELYFEPTLPPSGLLNYYYHLDCSWFLDSRVERQLTVKMETKQNRPCVAWNVTIYNQDSHRPGGRGETLHTFCPRDRRKEFELPWRTNSVVLRLRTMSRTPPEYIIKWQSQVVRANTRISGTTPPAMSIGYKPFTNILILWVVALLHC